MFGRSILIAGLAACCVTVASADTRQAPTLDAVVAKMGAYVAKYGEKAALIVAVEKYTQSVSVDSTTQMPRPRNLVAEFALVKTSGTPGWVGFRDVVEVNGEALRDRRDRLMSLFTSKDGDAGELERIANESARFNVGPVTRNFNVPTAAMLFFTPENLSRFEFTRKGTQKIDNVNTWEITFKETRSPTFVMNRAGKDVPMDGTVWVNPEDGTVVRTRMHMEHFADQTVSPIQDTPAVPGPLNPNARTAGPARNVDTLNLKPIESAAEIEVTFKAFPELGIWLPASMEETYNGPIRLSASVAPTMGHANTHAKYSTFKQFGTASAIVLPKQ